MSRTSLEMHEEILNSCEADRHRHSRLPANGGLTRVPPLCAADVALERHWKVVGTKRKAPNQQLWIFKPLVSSSSSRFLLSDSSRLFLFFFFHP